jgi:hypothetical protein
MPYFAVDDKLHSHPKAMRAGSAAIGLWTLAGSWSSDQGTDGFVPDYVAARLDPDYEVNAARLVEVRLWEVDQADGDKGWRFHEWTGDRGVRRQYTRAEVEEKRRAGAERQARSRERRAAVTQNVTRDTSVTHESVTPDVTVSSHVSHSDPSHPIPSLSSKSKSSTQGVDLSALPSGKILDEMPEEDKPAAMRSPLAVVRCPEHGQAKIGDCHWCKVDHGSRRYYADPDHWDETQRTHPDTAPGYRSVKAWAASR